MNTKITYFYRDADNFKQDYEDIVAGEITLEQLKPFLSDAGEFCPVDVGLQHPGPLLAAWPRENDHQWCEDLDCTPTEDSPTTRINAKQLLALFRLAHRANWPSQNTKPGNDDNMRFFVTLAEGNIEFPPATVTALVLREGAAFSISFNGYGSAGMMPGHGSQVYAELYEGKLMLRVWADINQEDPTHIIDLSGALESNRKQDNDD